MGSKPGTQDSPTEVPDTVEAFFGGWCARSKKFVSRLCLFPSQQGRHSPRIRLCPIDIKKKQYACDMLDCAVTDTGSFKGPRDFLTQRNWKRRQVSRQRGLSVGEFGQFSEHVSSLFLLVLRADQNLHRNSHPRKPPFLPSKSTHFAQLLGSLAVRRRKQQKPFYLLGHMWLHIK